MPDDDPIIVCCILQLCCPAGSTQQARQLARLIKASRPYLSHNQAEDAARQVLQKYDHFKDVRAIVDSFPEEPGT